MNPVPDVSPVLWGTRVRLRPLVAEDADALVEVSFYDGVPAGSPGGARAMLARIAEDQARGETIHWGIEDTSSGVLVGTVGFYRGFAGDAGEVGYVLLPAHRKRGFMTEAVALAVAYGFESLDLAAVIAHTDAENLASIAVLERCGFAHSGAEGEQRSFRVGRPA